MTRPFEVTGKHVLAIMISFFGVVLVVNAVFIALAVGTHRGATGPNAYADGLRYNERILAARRQDALGLRHELRFEGGRIRLSLAAADASRAAGLVIAARVSRPVTGEAPQPISFCETAPGVYEAHLTLAQGSWILEFAAERNGAVLYRGKDRLWLNPGG